MYSNHSFTGIINIIYMYNYKIFAFESVKGNTCLNESKAIAYYSKDRSYIKINK